MLETCPVAKRRPSASSTTAISNYLSYHKIAYGAGLGGLATPLGGAMSLVAGIQHGVGWLVCWLLPWVTQSPGSC